MSSIILITGASSGIGYHTALKLAVDNNIVIAVARNEEKLDLLRAEAVKQNAGSKLYPVALDLATMNYELLLNKLDDLAIRHLDCLINNAGLLINKPFEHLLLSDFKAMYDVNVFAPALLIQSVLPLLDKSKSAHIINISSMGGVQGASKFVGLSGYSSGKAALIGLTECLATELSSKNIKINCLALGAVNTEMLSQAFPGYEAPTSAQEMAQYISWFALNGPNYFNGKIIPVSVSNP